MGFWIHLVAGIVLSHMLNPAQPPAPTPSPDTPTPNTPTPNTPSPDRTKPEGPAPAAASPETPASPSEVQPEPSTHAASLVIAPKPVGRFADAAALLTELETADAGITRFMAGVQDDREFDLAADRQTRRGKLFFANLPAKPGERPTRRFAIKFDVLLIGKTRRDEERWYVFDGKYLLEKFPGEKRAVRTQVVGAGESFDPLRVGEGPFPLPIGQKKDETLKRYHAELWPAEDGLTEPDLRAFVKGAYQLRLTPKAEFAQVDDFREVRLWYSERASADGTTKSLLPRMVRAVTQRGDRVVAQLINVSINDAAKFDDAVFSTDEPEGWTVTTQEFRGRKPRGTTEKPAAAAPSATPAPAPSPPTPGESSPNPQEPPAKPPEGPENRNSAGR